jgi:hypothetical protein
MKVNNVEEEFTREDIEIARAVKSTYNCGMSRIALRNPEPVKYKGVRIDIFSKPKSASARIVIRSLKFEYAIQVWIKAALISAKNPSDMLYYWWLHWKDTDRPFRIIEYSNFYRDITVEQLLSGFWQLLEQVANSGDIKVCEGYNITGEGMGSTGPNAKCVVILSEEKVYDSSTTIKDVYNYNFDKTPVSFSWEDIKDYYCEMTLNQLRLTMPKELHMHTFVDDILFKAARDWDLDLIDIALQRGANINALNEYGSSALGCAVDFFNFHGMSLDKEYTFDEEQKIKEDNTKECKTMVDYLLSKGADINLFGFGGMTPLTCAYYARSAEMTKFLLERGANPNTNGYLDDCQYWPLLKNVRCTILDVIDDLLSDEYNDEEKEIEQIIRDAGGRQYMWDFTPWDYENVGKYVIRLTPSTNDEKVFVDNSNWKIGDIQSVTIEDAIGSQSIIQLPEVPGFRQWNKDFQDNISNITYDWQSWKRRGLSIAKQIAECLPDSVAFFYLRDNDEVMQKELYDGRLYFSHNGDYIRIK